MVNWPHRRALIAAVTLPLFAMLFAVAIVSHGLAQAPTPLAGADGNAQNVIEIGDIAVSGFSGTKLQSERLAPGVDPVAKTVLDPDGPTLEVLNSTVLGNLTGQTLLSPSRLSFTARDIGHVFALAFDNGADATAPVPSLFAAATSAFGLHIVRPDQDGDGQPDRLTAGAPGATFMDGQFGGLPGAGPGTIWRIDGKTGTPSLFAELRTGDLKNAGPGIGGLAFDPASRTLYASDLDTGLIHRLSAADRADKGTFDYGVVARPSRASKPAVNDDGKRLDITSPAFVTADPATWGLAQKERRIDALAVHDGRLYFAVAEGPEIWSVGLEADGAFKTDARFEVAVEGTPSFPVTGIAFEASGRMVLAQRGDVQNPADYASFQAEGPARVLRFVAAPPEAPAAEGLWQPAPEEYAVGKAEESRASAGGVALQYKVNADGTLDTATCSGTVVASGNTLGPDATVQGLQLSPAGLVKPGNVPPNDSAVIAWTPSLLNARARGYAGAVAVLHTCAGESGGASPNIAGAGADGLPGVVGNGGVTGGGGVVGDGGVAGGGGGAIPPDVVSSDADGGGGGKVQIGPITIEKVATTAACNENVPCSFDIKVTNTTGEPIPGPIIINDVFSVAGAPAEASELTSERPAPWSCVGTAGGRKSCVHPGPIPPNASLAPNLSLSLLPGPVGTATEVQNCATLASAIPEFAPEERKGIKVVVKSLSPSCASGSPCVWQVTGTNTTTAPITGRLLTGVGVAPAAGLKSVQGSQPAVELISASVPPGTNCKAIGDLGHGAACDNPQFTLAPGADVTATFTVKATVPAGTAFDTWAALGHMIILGATGPESNAGTTNLAFVGAAGKAPQNAEPPGTDAQACATIPIDPNATTQTGPITVVKKSTSKCTAKGPCAFTIAVTNSTDAEIQGPIVIDDVIDAPKAQIAGKPNDPWTCTNAAPFKCTHPGPLAAKQSVDLNIAFTPNTPPETTTLKNCAIPLTGVGGKIPPLDPNAPQKQIAPENAPEKKSEAPFDRSLFKPAKFSPQSFPQSFPNGNGLLHLTGGIGDISGGAALGLRQSPCRKFLRDGFSVRENNGSGGVSFTPLTQVNGKLSGTATVISPNGPVKGRVSGNIGVGNFDFLVVWDNGTRETYKGTIGAGGKATGTKVTNNGASVGFSSVAPLVCVEDEACFKYAKDATLNARLFQANKCGPSVTRWSIDNKHHLDFCMGQSSNAPILDEENRARKTELETCRSNNFCNGGYVKEALEQAERFKSLDCGAPPTLISPDPAVQMKACLTFGEGSTLSALKSKREELIATCVADKNKGGGGAGGGGAGGAGGADEAGGAGGGGAGGAGEAGGGAAQEPAPEQCATVPIEPDEKPGDTGGPAAKPLVLTKNPVAEKCSDTGGGCDFVVSITNTSDTDFTNPIAFTDHVSTADGTPLPNADFGSVQASLPPGSDVSAPFICRTGGGGLTCSTGAAKVRVPAKQTITFPMSIKPGPTGGATAIRNCAQLQLDNFAEPVCRTMPLVNGPLLRATKITAATSCKPECAFSVSIRNVGNADAIGPFAFTDRFTPASKIIPIFTQGGDFTCRLATEQGNGIAVCNGNKQRLAPGEQMLGKIMIMGVPLAPEYTNCIDIVPSGTPIDTTAPRRCVTIKEPRPNRADLAIQKAVSGKLQAGSKVGECAIEGPCDFRVQVLNAGNSAYNGPITFTDEIPAKLSSGTEQSIPASIEAKPNADWTCTKTSVRAISCTHKQTTLAAATGVVLDLVVTPGPGWKKNDVVTNCANIATPVGNDAGDNKVNDRECAQVQLDPFNVKISKTGDQACAPGSTCTFQLTLFNPGPIDHNAPVTITDKLTGLSSADIVSISPPLPCATQPTKIPFSCTSPDNVRLDVDAAAGTPNGPRTFVMVVKLPNDASAEQFSNCATVGNGTDGSDEACHTVSTKPQAQPAPVTPAPQEQCSGGMILVENACTCPPQTRWNGTECANFKGDGGINKTSPPDETPRPQPAPVTPPPQAQCSGGMILVENACTCPPQTQWNGTECANFKGDGGINTTRPPDETPRPQPAPAQPKPTPGSQRGCPENSRLVNGQCQCLPGFEPRRNVCRPVQQQPAPTQPKPTPRPQRGCPENARLVNGQCQCLPGFEPRRNVCRPVQQQPAPTKPAPTPCPQNARLVNGQCQCLPGFELRRRVCRPVQQQPTPQPAPRPPQTCPRNTPNGTPPNCCPRQMVFRNGQCVDDKCRKGMVGTPPNCTCPPGTTFRDDFCRAPKPPAPKPNSPTPPKPQAPASCRTNEVRENGRCVCKGRFELVNGQCVDKVF